MVGVRHVMIGSRRLEVHDGTFGQCRRSGAGIGDRRNPGSECLEKREERCGDARKETSPDHT